MNLYREGEMSLEQLMAFTITDDHPVQERVWQELSWNKSKEMIRRLLTEGQVEASDRRARSIGIEAYQTAGGHIIRDLFDAEHEGYFDNPELLNRLVAEKLENEANAVRAEGWKWVTVTPEFHYALASGMRRVFPEEVALSEEEQARLDALESEHEALSIQHADENLSEEIATQFEQLEAEIESLRQERYRPEDIPLCGAFVCLSSDGSLRVERGFFRPEDEPVQERETAEVACREEDEGAHAEMPEEEPDSTSSPLPDRLLADLSAHRTAALRDCLSQQPFIALLALTHALAAQRFYGSPDVSCLTLELKSVGLIERAPNVGGSRAVEAYAKRADGWAKRLPRDVADLWNHLSGLNRDDLVSLLAVCAADAVNALHMPWDRNASRDYAADKLVDALSLDMTGYWTPTVNSYFGAVTKAHILEALREGVSEEAAARLAGMKKDAMAKAAEKLLKGSGWLPAMLRAPHKEEDAAEACAIAAE